MGGVPVRIKPTLPSPSPIHPLEEMFPNKGLNTIIAWQMLEAQGSQVCQAILLSRADSAEIAATRAVQTRRVSAPLPPSKGEVTNMQAKKKKTKKKIKVQDLEPCEDPNGGMSQDPPKDTKWVLKHLQLGQRPDGGDKI
jgi:hypothetical protein